MECLYTTNVIEYYILSYNIQYYSCLARLLCYGSGVDRTANDSGPNVGRQERPQHLREPTASGGAAPLERHTIIVASVPQRDGYKAKGNICTPVRSEAVTAD